MSLLLQRSTPDLNPKLCNFSGATFREYARALLALAFWGAPWLVREILAARDQRLAGQPVEAPPPAPAIEWDE